MPELPPDHPDLTQVRDEEFLLRRYENLPNMVDECGWMPRVQAFCPNDNDIDGISLFREGDPFTTAEAVLSKGGGQIPESGGVTAILASAIREVGWRIDPVPDDGLPGHVIIPDLKRSEYLRDKNAFRAKMKMILHKCQKRLQVKPRAPKPNQPAPER